jgi:hypothetical protein
LSGDEARFALATREEGSLALPRASRDVLTLV